MRNAQFHPQILVFCSTSIEDAQSRQLVSLVSVTHLHWLHGVCPAFKLNSMLHNILAEFGDLNGCYLICSLRTVTFKPLCFYIQNSPNIPNISSSGKLAVSYYKSFLNNCNNCTDCTTEQLECDICNIKTFKHIMWSVLIYLHM